MTRAFIAMGSNVGDRAKALGTALDTLARELEVVAVSPTFTTVAVGRDGPAYLNAVFSLNADREPEQLLARLLEQEQQQGRIRREKWGPRTLDLDLLLFGDRMHDKPGCRVPHPALHERGFVLVPLVTIAADIVVPGLGARVETLFNRWLDTAGSGAAGIERYRGADAPTPRLCDERFLRRWSAAGTDVEVVL